MQRLNNLTDSHCHIYAEQFREDRGEALRRAFEAQVGRIFMPNIDHTSIDAMMETEAAFPENCFAMMGLHPCSVNKQFMRELYRVEEWLGKRPFAAIGETGIDLFWDKTFKEQQLEALHIQIELAKKFKLPIVLHTRDSFAETLEVIQQTQDGTLRGVFHCFTGTREDAEKAVELQFMLGIGGVATFKNGGLDQVLPHISLDYLLLETDAPYLAPVPHRGKRNEPAYLPLIADRIAGLKNVSKEEVWEKTTKNALSLFTL
jgi:TatD DNase family protein